MKVVTTAVCSDAVQFLGVRE